MFVSDSVQVCSGVKNQAIMQGKHTHTHMRARLDGDTQPILNQLIPS